MPFTPTTFIQDPVRPRLWDLLTPSEYSIYSILDPASRVNMVAEEIYVLSYRYSLMTTELIILGIRDNLKDILSRYQSLNRIQATPTPYAFVLDIIIYFYILISPFALKTASIIYFSPLLLCFMFVGVKKVCNLLEDPFGWTFFDIPFEKMALQLHTELHNAAAVGAVSGSVVESFIPEELLDEENLEKDKEREKQSSYVSSWGSGNWKGKGKGKGKEKGKGIGNVSKNSNSNNGNRSSNDMNNIKEKTRTNTRRRLIKKTSSKI